MTAPQTLVHMVRIERPNEIAAKLRSYRVLLDGREVGSVGQGEVLGFAVTSGRHTLQVKCDWTASNLIKFDGREGHLEFQCGNSTRTLPQLLLSLLYCTIWWDKALWIRRKAGLSPAE